MSPPDPAPLAETTRGGIDAAVVESRHVGHLVVIGPGGEPAAVLGDLHRPTFPRSAVKPFQATACLEVLAEHGDDDLSDAEVAIGWASHRAEPRHLAAVDALLARSGTASERLTCPADTGAADPTAAPTRRQHNCSGKHALFALAGSRLGVPRDALLDPSAALQRRVLALLDEVLGGIEAVGVDGCGAPAVVAPLDGLARAFHRLLTDDRFARVRAAGRAHPGLIGGLGRLDTALLEAGALAKAGAEGVQAAAWWDRDGRPWSLALKCEDGASRAASAAAGALFRVLGLLAEDAYAPEPMLGGGRPVGVVRSSADVVALAERLPAAR